MPTLSNKDQAMLAGELGPASQMAMSILSPMIEIYGASELMDISAAHIDSTVYQGEATMEYAEKFASLDAKVSVPTTLNVSGVDPHGWKDWAVPPDYAAKAFRQMQAYESMGVIPTWTCAPYQTKHKPVFGQQIAWGESNAICFANSVIGARTERYPDLLDICCAITGRVPASGLHLEENRKGQIVFELDGIPAAIQEDDAFYPVLGHYIGKHAQDKIPVIVGMEIQPKEDQLKAFGAATASSGAVAMFHMIGVTPEAPDFESAMGGLAPLRTIKVSMQVLRDTRKELSTHEGEDLDMVVLGSPHFSLAEFRELATLVEGHFKNPSVKFLITTSRGMRDFAIADGSLNTILKFGGELTVDTCILTSPMLPDSIKILMSNSAKYSYYAPGLLKTRVAFGALKDCVKSAIEGRVVTDTSLWDRS